MGDAARRKEGLIIYVAGDERRPMEKCRFDVPLGSLARELGPERPFRNG